RAVAGGTRSTRAPTDAPPLYPGTVSTAVIRVSAVVLRDGAGRVLTGRKRGTARFMFPGGKPEPGETPAQTAVRETREERGVELDGDRPAHGRSQENTA